jgi:hypothetical protein
MKAISRIFAAVYLGMDDLQSHGAGISRCRLMTTVDVSVVAGSAAISA